MHSHTDAHTNTLNTLTQEKYSLRGCTNWPGPSPSFSSTADVFSSAWEDHSLTSRAVVRATTKEWDLDLRSTVVTESALRAQNTNLPLDKALGVQLPEIPAANFLCALRRGPLMSFQLLKEYMDLKSLKTLSANAGICSFFGWWNPKIIFMSWNDFFPPLLILITLI